METKTDYNKIASAYDERYKSNYLPKVEESLLSIASEKSIRLILEAGCGTGRWLKALTSLNKKLFGLDYSIGMLKVADTEQYDLMLINADACKLPFAKNSFDMIFCINAIHHFPNKELFFSEATATLSQNGIICIYGVDPQIDKDWYVYDYFNEVYEKDLERFPSLKETKKLCELFGLRIEEQMIVEKVYSERIGDEVFSDPFLKKHMNSQLANLSDEEYQKGMERIKYNISVEPETKFITDIKFYLTKARKES
ncbi:SAM-dependent methyltransferase [Ignavibacterium album JCM 16511]|uniref:SAM-dependent methyltransferase n=1 Tax=Ignavibacterium album (strain DSM 19864 / JCM 16511 / NBRC 101810 / Mat9-16) TaxID=945713 RepID=I0AFI7_IGNAJ|nr:class I SAM-dependent methyltransferase [Ignavibacterium album]AFH47744.1 SAM-dependent methyltransferase [Ignavibacterium album JCM 16511]